MPILLTTSLMKFIQIPKVSFMPLMLNTLSMLSNMEPRNIFKVNQDETIYAFAFNQINGIFDCYIYFKIEKCYSAVHLYTNSHQNWLFFKKKLTLLCTAMYIYTIKPIFFFKSVSFSGDPHVDGPYLDPSFQNHYYTYMH